MPKAYVKRSASEAGAYWEREREEDEEEQCQSEPPPAKQTTAKSSKRGTRGIALTRSERAKIRILHQHGLPQTVIRSMMGRCAMTVRNVLRDRKQLDEDSDYNYVDAAFRARFPPAPSIDQSNPPVPSRSHFKRSVSSDDVPLSKVVKVRTPRPPSRRLTCPPTSRSTCSITARTQPVLSKGLANKRSSSILAEYFKPIQPESDGGKSHDGDDDETHISSSPSLIDFLSSLAHDITWVHEDLEQQDLGSVEKLFALAHWPEKDLHMMFKEALPSLTVPQRFMLVKGMREQYAKMEGVER